MKILTLNTHSLHEEHYSQKLAWFVDAVLRKGPDLIAMQEVNQTISAPDADAGHLEGFVPLSGVNVPVRWDNHAAEVAFRLRQAGVDCSWTWLPIKVGYGRYDEGVALISLGRKIEQADQFPISKSLNYQNWKTRRVLGVKLAGLEDWFYTVHMGWWQDPEEPFRAQWERLNEHLAEKKAGAPVWLLGDFNSPAEVRGEGYDCIAASGWQDTYLLARQRGAGVTVEGEIDGWRDKLADPRAEGIRIDQIWCSRAPAIEKSCVIFNGTCGPQVSDHYAVLVNTAV